MKVILSSRYRNYSTHIPPPPFPTDARAHTHTHTHTHLKYAGTIRCSPCIKEIVFASCDEPFASVGKLERDDRGIMEVQLVHVLLWSVDV